MSGAKSRRKGNVAEQAVCAALERMGVAALTSRNARGGRQSGVDIICPDLPVSVEVKNGSRDELPSWVDQAVAQGDETAPGAVWHKRRGKADAEDWFITMRARDFVELVRIRVDF